METNTVGYTTILDLPGLRTSPEIFLKWARGRLADLWSEGIAWQQLTEWPTDTITRYNEVDTEAGRALLIRLGALRGDQERSEQALIEAREMAPGITHARCEIGSDDPIISRWVGALALEILGYCEPEATEEEVPWDQRADETSAEEPWMKIPDRGWDRKALELWRSDYKAREIGERLNLATGTVLNKLCELRRKYGPEVVPRRRPRRVDDS